jgi:hypothetical protein
MQYRHQLMLALVFILSACSAKNEPVASSPGAPLEVIGAKQDKIDGRVAAAVVVASEANDAGKPKVVKSELSVASAYLPKPSEADVAFARQRAEKGDIKQYEREIEYAKKINEELTKVWAEAEKQKRLNEENTRRLEARVKELQDDQDKNWYTMAAMVCFGIALVMALMKQFMRAGIAAMFGVFMGSIPRLMNTEWFMPFIGVSILTIIGSIIWHVRASKKDEHTEG